MGGDQAQGEEATWDNSQLPAIAMPGKVGSRFHQSEMSHGTKALGFYLAPNPHAARAEGHVSTATRKGAQRAGVEPPAWARVTRDRPCGLPLESEAKLP